MVFFNFFIFFLQIKNANHLIVIGIEKSVKCSPTPFVRFPFLMILGIVPTTTIIYHHPCNFASIILHFYKIFDILFSEVFKMSRCVRCGGSFLTRFKIKLKDNYICRKCALELGFDKDFYLRSTLYSWDDIKDGYEAYRLKERKKEIKNAVLSSISVSMKGAQERELICTEEEREIFNEIEKAVDGVKLIRRTDNYLTVAYKDWDLIRIKYSPSAKWLWFCVTDKDRTYIESPEEVLDYFGKLDESIAHINKYSK